MKNNYTLVDRTFTLPRKILILFVLGFLCFSGPNSLKAQAIECEPCNFTPLFPETFVEVDLSFIVLGKDFNQEIQGLITPLWDGLVPDTYDARGLVSVGLNTDYNGELLCPGETIPLNWQGLDVIAILYLNNHTHKITG